jgi:CRISPR type I-A-associated protein Csa5
MAERKEDIIRKHVRVRNLLTSVALAMGHYTLLDRLNNAVSIDAVQKTIYEVSRIAETLLKQEKLMEISKEEVKEGKKESKPYIIVDVGEGYYYEFYGALPSSSDIDEFLTDSLNDIRTARIIGASAMGLVASVVESGKKSKKSSSIVVGGGGALA